VHIKAVNEVVDVQALSADVMQKASRITGEDFVDGCVAQHGAELADGGLQLLGRAPAAGLLNALDGLARAFDAVMDGVGKVAVEHQELEHALRREISRVDLAVGLECRATTHRPTSSRWR